MRGCRVRPAHQWATLVASFVFLLWARTPVQSQVGIFDAVAFPVDPNSGVDCFGQGTDPFAAYDAGADEYNLGHMGGDVWSEGDTFSYAYSNVRGDFTLSVHVKEFASVQEWGKVAIMARRDLTTTSRHNWVHKAIFPDGDDTRKTIWGGRPVHGNAGGSFNTHGGNFTDGDSYAWLQIARSGQQVFGRGSHDGATWDDLGTEDWGPNIPDDLLVGLVLCGNSNNCGLGNTTGTFDEVDLIGTVVDPPGPGVPPPSAERSTTTAGPECPPSVALGGPVDVTIEAAPVADEDLQEVFQLSERARGDFGEAEVTVSNGGVVEEVLGAGGVGIFNEAKFYVDPASGQDCTGNVGEPSATYDAASDTYELRHMGGDVWHGGDTFEYAFNRITGDFVLTAEVLDKSSPNEWGKVSMMVRQDETTRSRFSWIVETNFADGNTTNKTIWAWRPVHGNPGTSDNSHGGSFDGPRYSWLRIERIGNTVLGSGSDDGANWIPIDHFMNPHDWGEDMPDEVLAGLVVCGNSTNCGTVGTGTFGEVDLVLGAGSTIRKVGGGGDTPVGVNIDWSVTRAELQAGVGYSIDIDEGAVEFSGELVKPGGVPRVTGGESLSLVRGEAVTVYEPFGGFGTGLTRAHAIGAECPGMDVQLDNGDLVVTGAGRGVSDGSDQVLYAYEEDVTGDFSTTLTIGARELGDDSSYGIMARADCGPTSGSVALLDGGSTIFLGRAADSFETVVSGAGGFDLLRLQRVGTLFTAHVFDEEGALQGAPGVWVQVGERTWADAPASLNLGIAVASGDECTPVDVTFEDWQVGPPETAASPPVRSVASVQDSCPGGGTVTVTIQQDLGGANAAEMVSVSEFLTGGFSAGDVTPTDGGVVAAPDLGIFAGLAFPVHPVDGVDCTGTSGQPSASHINGTYTLTHNGGDVWSGGDTFAYLFNGVRGDFSLSARIVRTESQVDWGKTALMVRQSLETNSRLNWTIETMWPAANPLNGTAKTVWAGRTVHGQEGAVFNTRETAGADLTGPRYSWLRIERQGGELVGSGSFDGADWQILDCDMAGIPCNPMVWVDDGDVPDMPDELLVGLTVVGNVRDCNVQPGEGVLSDVDLILGDGAELVPVGEVGQARGATITWNVSRQQLAQGIGYTVEDPASLTMAGSVENDVITGPTSADTLPPPTVDFGPLAFGSGFDHIHMIGGHCDTVSATAADGELVLLGAGDGIANSDQFLFAYKEVTGDFSASVTMSGQGRQSLAQRPESRFGIMARQSCHPNSRHAAVLDADPFFIESPPGEEAPKGAGFFSRDTHLQTGSGETLTGQSYNEYRLDRQGNELIGFYRDGGQWVEIDRRDWGADAPASLFLGLAVVSAALDGQCTPYDVTFEDWLVVSDTVGPPFRRGDANGDGATNLADAVATFNFLFLGGDEPPCLDAADANDVDNALNLTDGVFLLNFLFLGGDPIADPGPFDCGPEPDGSPFTFGCDQYLSCGL